MIINPIIPVWLMSIICIILIILVIYNKQIKDIILKKSDYIEKKKNSEVLKHTFIKSGIKIAIIVLLFLINLRFMVPNGESTALTSDYSVLFVIDTSVSMKALDYDGNKERIEGVINDCCYIVDELANSRFSIITFGDTARRVIPFTTDSDMVQAELKAITLEDDYYAKGTSMNIVKDVFEKTLESESKKRNDDSKIIVFFVTDGEITKEGEILESFSSMSKYIYNGAVLGYGTRSRGQNA